MPKRTGRQHNAFVVEAGHQHIDAVADRTQHVLLRHLAVGEHQFAGVGAAHAELVELLRRRETLEAFFDDERGDAARAGGAVGLGVDHQRVGHRPVGDPHLRAVEDVAVAFLVGARAHRHDVGAGARLRHRQRADMLAGNQFRQVFALLLLTAVAAELVDAKIGMRAVGQADGGAGARDFLHRHAMLEIAEAGAAIFLLDRDAVQAERAHLRPQVARKNIVAVDRVGARRDTILRETAHGFAQHVDVGAEAEIEARPGIGDHAPPPLARPDRRRRRLYKLIVTLSAPRPTPAWACRPAGPLPAARRSRLAGAGLANRKPCISSQPASRSRTRWCSVSTPSTSTDRPSARPSATIAWMITPPLEERPSAATKLWSILSLSSGKPLQITEIGIAGAEIVERDTHAEFVQILDALDHLVRIVDQHAFGDFQHQPRRRHAAFGQRRTHHVDDRAVAHLHRRQIHRNVKILGPSLGLLQCAAQNESADRVHQSHLLGDRNERCRRNRSARRVVPAQQSLDADHAPALRRHDRLIMQIEIVRADRARQARDG